MRLGVRGYLGEDVRLDTFEPGVGRVRVRVRVRGGRSARAGRERERRTHDEPGAHRRLATARVHPAPSKPRQRDISPPANTHTTLFITIYLRLALTTPNV